VRQRGQCVSLSPVGAIVASGGQPTHRCKGQGEKEDGDLGVGIRQLGLGRGGYTAEERWANQGQQANVPALLDGGPGIFHGIGVHELQTDVYVSHKSLSPLSRWIEDEVIAHLCQQRSNVSLLSIIPLHEVLEP